MRTSLTLADLVGLTIISTMLFLIYPGLLWQSPVGASHVDRFVVSYLAVIPLAAGATLLRWGRIRALELTVAVALVWAVKMLVTVGLYHLMVQGTAPHLEPAHTESRIPQAAENPYVVVSGFQGATLAGRVVDRDGKALMNALVVLPSVERGKPFLESSSIGKLEYDARGMNPPLGVLLLGQRMTLRNLTDSTVVLRATLADRGAFNIAVLPQETVSTAKQQHRGLMRIHAGTAESGATGWSCVVGNPYFAWSDSNGAFSIADVPAETHDLQVYAVVDDRLFGTNARVATGTGIELTVEERVSGRVGQ
jgi:hypothetical protein